MTISDPIYVALPAAKLAVGASGGTMIDLFNGTTDRLLRVRSARVFPDMISAIAGTRTLFRLQRTTDVGTGGTAITPLPFDPGLGFHLGPGVTGRSLPTGGATLGGTLGTLNLDPDEAVTGAIAGSGDQGELIPSVVRDGPGMVLRPSAGLAIVAEGSSLVANVWAIICFQAQPFN